MSKTLHESVRDLGAALRDFFIAYAKALHIPQIMDWIRRRLPARGDTRPPA